nr:hypothetical protein Iba_chr08aCG9270 [Ipomoea batatas]GMD23819.1 hypothetical protein Iba_chr08bCG8940 [Ipomoea batatas]GMD27104.1 hypothetical protein Iba_chr08dCG10580 [Ipomoea batatas]
MNLQSILQHMQRMPLDRFYWFLGNTVAKNELLFFGQQFRIIKRPVTDPRYIPLYTRANDLLLSETGTHFERRLFIAGMATPWNRENGIGSAESNESISSMAC